MDTARLSVNLKQNGDSTVLGRARAHSVVIDRPHVKGGKDRGPMGGELLLLSLGGCYFSTFLAAMKAEYGDFPTEPIEIMVTGILGSVPSRITDITLTMYASMLSKEKLEKPAVKAERGCIVHNSIKSSIPVHFNYIWLSEETFPSMMPST